MFPDSKNIKQSHVKSLKRKSRKGGREGKGKTVL
jgi:hypothetical protein